MGMLDRYRKKGGFAQLLNTLETTGKDKQDKFLKMIHDENPAWETELKKRILTVEKIMSWNSAYLAEIFPRIQPLQLAMIVGGLSPEKATAFMNVLTFKERKQVEELLKEKKPSPGETSAGVMKLFSEIRKMEAEGSLKFEKFDAEMVIPEDIEDKLGKGVVSLVSTASIDAAVASMEAAPAGLPSNVAEELTALRRKLVQLTQENQKLNTEVQSMRDKLDQIRKIA